MAMDKATIVHLLATDDRAIARAILVLTDRQTDDEQRSENTKYLNGRGWRPCHARMGTSMAAFFRKTGFLTPRQIAHWRKPMADGNTRIQIYWKQLLEEAELKQAKKAHEVTLDQRYDEFDADQRHKKVLEFELGAVLDSDDPALIDPAKQTLDEFMALIKNKKY